MNGREGWGLLSRNVERKMKSLRCLDIVYKYEQIHKCIYMLSLDVPIKYVCYYGKGSPVRKYFNTKIF